MNVARRAIIMAAGFGSRLRPVTLETPKPLITVNGRRMVDTIIEALHKHNIFEIYIVVGYMKEQFLELVTQYDGVTLIDNPYYAAANNISSLYVARDYLADTFIVDGDQIVYNSDIFQPEFDRSGYCAAWATDTNEWLLTVEDDVVTDCSRVGGQNGYQLYGVSMWSEADGQKLRAYLEKEFIDNKNTEIYWDDIALFCYREYFQLGIRNINHSDIKEIDSYEELLEEDAGWRKVASCYKE